MIHLLQIGFGLLLLGLNLITIWVALNATGENMPANIKKLGNVSWIVLLIGAIFIGFGAFNYNSIDLSVINLILSAGVAVLLLGLAALLRIWGQKHPQVVWGGALFTAGIGLGFVLSYIILYYWG